MYLKTRKIICKPTTNKSSELVKSSLNNGRSKYVCNNSVNYITVI